MDHVRLIQIDTLTMPTSVPVTQCSCACACAKGHWGYVQTEKVLLGELAGQGAPRVPSSLVPSLLPQEAQETIPPQ